jgi:putative ABC transport system permease protein
MRFLHLISGNLFRNKMRSILTVCLMAAIFFFVTTLLSILATFDNASASSGVDRLAVQSAVSLATMLPYSHETKIRQIPGIAETAKLQWIGAYYKDQRNFFANFAVDADKMKAVWTDYVIDPAQFEAFKADRQGCLVGPELLTRFQWKVGQKIVLKGTIFPFDPQLTIRGVYYHPANKSALYFHTEYFREAGIAGQGLTGTVWVRVTDTRKMAAISQQIDEMFKNSEYPTETFTEKEFQKNFMSMMGNIKLLFTSVSLCAIFMVILLAAITMSMSARERVTEIAVLKAIGYRPGLVLGLMLVEFVLLTLIGGLVGTLAAKGFYHVFDIVSFSQGFLAGFQVYWRTIALCVAASALVGILAGGYPAYRAANLSVVDGLRKVV